MLHESWPLKEPSRYLTDSISYLPTETALSLQKTVSIVLDLRPNCGFQACVTEDASSFQVPSTCQEAMLIRVHFTDGHAVHFDSIRYVLVVTEVAV